MVHIAEATYRIWPLGRRYTPEAPRPVTDRMVAAFLKILVVVIAVGVIGYVVAGLLM